MSIDDSAFLKIFRNCFDLTSLDNGQRRFPEPPESKIIFTSGNQYTYLEGKIYFNKILICRDVSSCRFIYNESTNEVTASITISGKNYTNTYKLV